MQVAFHLNVPAAWPARSRYLCRLLAKAYAARARVWVVVSPDEASPLDEALWTVLADDFVPHVRVGGGPELLVRHSPIVIATAQDAVVGPRQVLVNAQPEWLPVLDAAAPPFARVIDVVTTDEADKQAARQRWRRFQGMGLQPVAHDRAARAAVEGGGT
ncbi:DNA polymerase III subunit chi [Tepidimonas charontis]|uniref:DNA polymerase III subunit chi n=1 Tax=Tepidimonas charontis TaxID=2267262 RepID=A0A554XKZ6_9BURK|nr:DNA polymerase III subunit chi [Tepidimonas charontis]TSE36503.1 DNA polymerase III subunit chi [Tepidimonas charontis]